MGFLHRFFVRLIIRTRIKTNKSGGSAAANSIANAAQVYLKNNFGKDELNVFGQIERIREDLNRSAEEISMRDYGAGIRGKQSGDSKSKFVTVIRKLGRLNKRSAKPEAWSRFIYSLIRELKPSSSLELGTCTGITSMYIAAAKKNSGGRLITIEGDITLSSLARLSFQKLGFDNIDLITGNFDDVLPEILHNGNKFDFVFVDGNHREEPTVRYFEMISPYMNPGGVILFDDISWSKEMRSAWSRITASERVGFSADLYEMGICLLN